MTAFAVNVLKVGVQWAIGDIYNVRVVAVVGFDGD